MSVFEEVDQELAGPGFSSPRADDQTGKLSRVLVAGAALLASATLWWAGWHAISWMVKIAH